MNMNRLGTSSLLLAHGLIQERSRKPTSGPSYPTEVEQMAKQTLLQFRLLVQGLDGEVAWARHLPVMLDLGVFHLELIPSRLLLLLLVVDHWDLRRWRPRRQYRKLSR